MKTEKKPNRLINETSPYLVQHAYNPVDWHPWGEEAFERARRENKPIFLSIGYSACHWCHVMEKESFEDEDVAQLLNEHFIPIKVDREERPDVDTIYMNAVQLMTGGGGWPLSVFLTPDLKPFYGGTYFPPHDRHDLPAFRRVLEEVAQVYASGDEVEKAAERLIPRLRQSCDIEPRGSPDSAITPKLLDNGFRGISAAFDGDYGGFGTAPKFPHPTALAFLLRYHVATGEPHALTIVEMTLERMARGGIHDQLGGGFHRYSTDERWLVPHFEKMLNDNALLAAVYLDAFRLTGKPLYRRIVCETLDYVLREMTGPQGGFYTAQDADSPAGEGEYYLWTVEEIIAIVGRGNSEALLRHFGVEAIGNFEGARSVLSIAATADEVARQLGRDATQIETAIAEGRRALFDLRQEKPAPSTDDKILAAWNGLMISAMARAGAALAEQRYIAAARDCAEFVLTHMRGPDGALLRSYRQGKCRGHGFLPDYAFLIAGLADLCEATFEPVWLEEAIALAEVMVARFHDSNGGGFFYSEESREPLPARPKDGFDNPDPSGNGAAAFNLLRLAELTERQSWEDLALETLRLFVPTILRSPLNTGQFLAAADFYLARPTTVIIAGASGDPATRALVEAVQHAYLPNAIVALADPTDAGVLERTRRLIPALEGKIPSDGRPTAYVCCNRTCGPPTTDPADLLRQPK